MRTAAFWCVLGLMGSATSPTRASDDTVRARELFRAGELAFREGDYPTAALAFEAANTAAMSGGSSYNAGVAWQRAKALARAADAFARAIDTGGLDDTRHADALARLAALKRSLGVLSVSAPAELTFSVAHLRSGHAPRRVHLSAGRHRVEIVWADGHRSARDVELVAGRETALRLAEHEHRQVDPEMPSASQPAERERAARSHSSAPLGWTLIATGALSMGAGFFLLSRGISAREEFDDSGRRDAGAHDRAVAYRTWSTVTLFGGAALAASGGVVLVLDP